MIEAMRRLIVGSLGMVILLALAMGTGVLIGQARPPSEQVERMHLTDCALPCWNEITPRASSLSDVQQRLASTFPDFKHLSSINLPFQTWTVDDLKPNNTSIEVTVDDGSIYSVSIETRDGNEQMPTLGDVLAILGAPLCVNLDAQSGGSTFVYENAAHQAMVQVSVAQPSLFSPVESIFVGGAKTFTCQDIQALSWPEFRASARSFSMTF